MAEEREAAFPLEKFVGIDRNTVREKSGPLHFWASKNLWEKTLNLLETRGGSEQFANDLPTPVTKVMAVHKLYKSNGDTARIAAIKCTPAVDDDMALPSGFALSFVNDATGYWNKARTFDALDWKSGATVSIRFVGYGVDKWYNVAAADIPGYSGANDQKLRITITSAQATVANGITGYEVYSLVNAGSIATPKYFKMWTGFKSLIGVTSATHDFLYTPLGQSGATTDGTEIGEVKRVVTASAYDSGTGTLQRGKTYYVGFAAHHIKVEDDDSQRSMYEIPGVDRASDNNIIPVTIPDQEGSWSIRLSVDINTVTGLLLIGESPELMQPVSILNDVAASSNKNIDSYPEGCPGLVDLWPTEDGIYTYRFRFSDYAHTDMFMRINDDGSYAPVFCSRLSKYANDHRESVDQGSQFRQQLADNVLALPQMGSESKYAFKQFGNLLYLVNGYDVANIAESTIGYTFYHRTNSNYMLTDGYIAGPVIEAFQQRTVSVTFTDAGDLVTVLNGDGGDVRDGDIVVFPEIVGTTGITEDTEYYVVNCLNDGTFKLADTYGGSAKALTTNGTGTARLPLKRATLPIFDYIEAFEGSIVLGGGPLTVDPVTGLENSAARTLYFTQALTPYDFTVPGGEIYQTVAVRDDEENIRGLGIYSNTTGDSGPFSQLLTGKKNRLYVLNSLPTADGGALDTSVRQITLSAKVGLANHNMIVNTPIGTVVVANDNVYVLRDTGEPTPIGQEISPILKGADLTNGFACYHDRHLKLSFYHEDYDEEELGSSINNVEFWLNINKMIEQKGGSAWVGPMIGHNNQFCFVEDKDGDGLDGSARDRVCCDGIEARIYKTDVVPDEDATEVTDFENLVEIEFDSKEFEISPQDNNWNKLLKRSYWKTRVCNAEQYPATLEEETYIDGSLFETKEVETYGDTDVYFDDQTLKLNRIFPTGRPRGRTVRKILRTKSRIGIAAFQLNYQVERRRI